MSLMRDKRGRLGVSADSADSSEGAGGAAQVTMPVTINNNASDRAGAKAKATR